MASLRGPSVEDPLLVPLAGSKPIVSDATAIVMLPPGRAVLPDGVGAVVATTLSKLPWVFGFGIVVAAAFDFFVVVTVALAVVVGPAAAAVVDVAWPGAAVV